MKKLRYIIIAFLSLGLFSCSDYLEHNFNDQMTIEEVFSKRPTTERFLAGLYGYIPEEINAYDQSFVPCADEPCELSISGSHNLNLENVNRFVPDT